MFGLRPAAGRWITRDDDRGAARHVAVISARLWQDWDGRDPTIAERVHITLNGVRFAVVGVAADGFHGVEPSLTPPEVWIPEGTLAAVYPRRDPHWFQGHWVTMFLRPRAGASVAELTTRTSQALAGGLFDRAPAHIKVRPAPASVLSAAFRWYMTMGYALAALVLAAACANVANLFYARAAGMRVDLAVRRSLGAGFLQLMMPLGAEAAWIGMLASLTGAAAAALATRAFTTCFPVFVVDRVRYAPLTIPIDWRMATYAGAAGLGTAALVGVAAALVAARQSPMTSLCAGGTPAVTRRMRIRTTLVAIQVTAALLLAMVAGLALENQPPELFRTLQFDATRVVAARADSGGRRGPPGGECVLRSCARTRATRERGRGRVDRVRRPRRLGVRRAVDRMAAGRNAKQRGHRATDHRVGNGGVAGILHDDRRASPARPRVHAGRRSGRALDRGAHDERRGGAVPGA